ncbi:calcium-translocating P-type ATPase, PMCA-type [Clostridium botulinum C]|uniref:P-type Ca(2+) transporter n=2 Tax=Clostridium botulinum TaxID=1491 RepID=A0A9Q4TH10_CLOBO|nr:calcium-translocating P-type ATPase, PMCA-type [Clostridium botulinum]MCD3194128.1 calcium-translocating P-type ATPase, PMCA-type [Clostridium botulinum C]MCD3199243.1 calcium-translocating P-type ATPase, PMCA-type [Clostridium botulinum C]MCD3204718.1 calcium-translocating P-type ATPase, PMCA-type [Clostridium botulinum C]MCD3208061.1 calcium-translocating P-type ATPase, PMCA-type [Clostridium botulinum C]MCD3224999.1 calcium-translocating P-type ATPase, PMCA-type [Clostridium botulinum C]
MDNEKFLKKGLTSDEAKKRMKEYGPNILEKKKRISPVKIFLEQFNDFIIWVLISATILSAIMGQKADAITIVIIVVMNAILGFIQEYKTEKSLEALQNLTAPTSKVLRDQEVKVISAEELVPGDIIILESGDRIPADSMLIEGNSLVVDESLLTGESVGVDKNCNNKNNNIYMGTVVLKGKGRALVENTGMKTEMGKIADMLDNIESDKSPLKKKLASLGKVMVAVCIVICIVVTIMGIIRGQDKYEMFLLGVSLAVAAIPEGMPAIVTVALALGVSRMLKRNALIRKLPAVETLGCTSIICSDKTGTLTQNKMTVEKVYFNDKIFDLNENNDLNFDILKKTFVYCNDCGYDFNQKNYEKMLLGDPTETALVKALFKKASDLKDFLKKSQRLYDIPFDSTRKMMSVIMEERGKKKCYVKGAPERVIDRCKYILMNNEILEFTDEYRRRVNKKVEEMSYNALRCIAAAYKDKNVVKGRGLEEDLIFVGIAGMKDPPRPEAKEAVLKCKMAGIKPVMITGDHKNTAYAIAKELRICKNEDEVITGEELDKLSEKELIKKVNKISVFARVSPKHKLSIVRAFKKRNNIVAMTGDGVNDAPAVKEADIGVSMGISGTDVTKEASSMILLDDNFTTIVSAVEEGRIIYDNIRKFIRYLLSCNLGEVLTMFLSSLFYLETPLLPIQILFINLATDGLPAIALGVDPADKDIMLRKPRDKNESIFARGLKEKIILRGSLIGVCTIFAFLSGKYYGMDLKTCRTLALCTLIMSQLLHVFECRSENHSIFEIKLFTNMYLVGAVTVSICMLLSLIYNPFLQGIFHTVPLHLGQWAIIIFFSGFISFINSLYLLFRKR